jgi:hypothetical protein
MPTVVCDGLNFVNCSWFKPGNLCILLKKWKMGRGNPNPKNKFTKIYAKPVADRYIPVKLPLGLDADVRSVTKCTEWLRKAIALQVE